MHRTRFSPRPVSVASLSFLSIFTAFSAALTSPVQAANISVPALPKGFSLDGTVSEWTGTPTYTLGAGNQIAGADKVKNANDFAAKVWLAQDSSGIYVAGDVTDDAVLFPQNNDQLIKSDHVEFWLSLPSAAMPPIGYANQFGDFEVSSPAACEGTGENIIEDPAGCKKWWQEQKTRRDKMQRLFNYQYGLTSLGVSELYGSLVTPELFKNVNKRVRITEKGPTASSVKFTKTATGYSFEGFIALDDFPASAEWPLKNAKVVVDIVDNDTGNTKQETFLSSTPKRKFGDANTFDAFTLDSSIIGKAAVAPDTQPAVMGFLLGQQALSNPSPTEGSKPDFPSFFYYPVSSKNNNILPEAFVFHNPAQGYQYSPTEPSPDIMRIPLGKLPERLRLGDVTIYESPFIVGLGSPYNALLSIKGGKIVGQYPMADMDFKQVAPFNDGSGALFWLLYEGPMSRLGAGQCGACPSTEYTLVSVDKTGKFTTGCEGSQIDGNIAYDDSLPEGSSYFVEGVTYNIDAKKFQINISGNYVPVDEGKDPPKKFSHGHRFDVASKQCVELK